MQQQTQTVYTSASDASRFNYLQTKNYLGEYKTDVEKARVRYNLGIPDSFAMTWGNISGSVANQSDLVSYIRSVKNDILNQYRSSADDILSLQEAVSVLNANATSLNTGTLNNRESINAINATLSGYASLMERIQTGLDNLSDIRTDVAQNATDIADLYRILNESSGGGSGSTLLGRISSLENAITSIQSSISSLSGRISSLEGQLGEVTLTSITLNYSTITDVTPESEGRTVTATAKYSNGSTKNVTNSITLSSNNTSVVTVDNTDKTIHFVGVGSTTVTVTYQNLVKTISITVGSVVEAAKPQYIGFGTNYNEAYMASKDSGFTSLNGSWTMDTIPCSNYDNGTQLDIYIITTQEILSVEELGVVQTETIATGVTFNEIGGYSVYKVLVDSYEYPVTQYNSKLTITTR